MSGVGEAFPQDDGGERTALTGLLRIRDEDGRKVRLFVGPAPTRQCVGAHQPTRCHFETRLKTGHNPWVAQGR